MNPKPGLGTPDLKLSGDFQNSFVLKKKGKNYLFDATVPYKKYITPARGAYGYDNVLGLSDKSQKKANEIIYNQLMAEIRKDLGL